MTFVCGKGGGEIQGVKLASYASAVSGEIPVSVTPQAAPGTQADSGSTT